MTSEHTLVSPYHHQMADFVEDDKLYLQLSSIVLKISFIYMYSVPFTENILYFPYRVNVEFQILTHVTYLAGFSPRNLCAQDLVSTVFQFLS